MDLACGSNGQYHCVDEDVRCECNFLYFLDVLLILSVGFDNGEG